MTKKKAELPKFAQESPPIPGAKLNKSRVQRNVDWIRQHLRVPEGRLVGKPVELSPAQLHWMEMIYGTPTRMWVCSLPRKSGKTSFTAMLLLLHLCGPEAVQAGQLFSAAQSRDQASVLFALAAKMCRMSAEISDYVVIKESAKSIICPELGTVYRALSAEASTAMGLSPAFVAHDELGQVKGPRFELYEALETACAAQENPISIVISTQATTDADLLSLLVDDALTGENPEKKCILYTVPENEDPFDMAVLSRAMPNWHMMNQKEVESQAKEAKRLPSLEAGFRNLIANQRIEGNTPFVTRSVWSENGAEPEPLSGPVWGGLDLSSVSDLTALVLVDGKGNVDPTFWLPDDGLSAKARSDRVPWDVWRDRGVLRTTPGRAIEYDFVAVYLRDVFDRHNIQAIAFDRYNMRFLKPCLLRAGFNEAEMDKFVEFGQGFISMSPAIRELESRLLSKKLRHGMHPVLSMCASNGVCVSDPAGNRKFAKNKASGRIDGLVSLAMAVGAMPHDAEQAKGEPSIMFL